MWDSESEEEQDRFIPAVLQRPLVANYSVHENFSVDTRDHEDHTFCGVMFDVICKAFSNCADVIPLEFMQITAISVRGDLGPMTVWTTPNSFRSKEHDQDSWQLVYKGDHAPSRREYLSLELDSPIKLSPGERCGIYVHSSLPGDDAIVYDNSRRRGATYEDKLFRVLTGKAHLSNRPFGRSGMFGFPWRDDREFVGRFTYGARYKLWNPEVHTLFPPGFRRAVRTLLLCASRPESPLHFMQNEVIFYILNMCRHDWFPADVHQQDGGAASSTDARVDSTLQTFNGHDALGANFRGSMHPSLFRPMLRSGGNAQSESSDDDHWDSPSAPNFGQDVGGSSDGSDDDPVVAAWQWAVQGEEVEPDHEQSPLVDSGADTSSAESSSEAAVPPYCAPTQLPTMSSTVSSDDEMESAFQNALQSQSRLTQSQGYTRQTPGVIQERHRP